MNLSKNISALALCLTFAAAANAQGYEADSTGLPGDNFSLQGALALFKKAGKPDEFEKLINSKDNRVNNLDLNADGKIDYIKVTNRKEKDVQIFVLSALVSAEESQDIAVISLQKTAEANAVIQIEGDAEIYGEPTFAEPAPENENAFNYNDFSGSFASNELHGPAAGSPTLLVVNVWFWPCVQFVYQPAYVVYSSPYTYVAPPVWYQPYQPMPYYEYHPYCVQYYEPHYVYVPTRRIATSRVMYRPVRAQSVTVIERNRVIVDNYRSTRVQPNRTYYSDRGGRYDSRPAYNNGGRPGYNNGRGNGGYYSNGGRTSPGGYYNEGGGRSYSPGNNNSGRAYTPNPNGRTYDNTGSGRTYSPPSGSTGDGRTYSPPATGNTGGGRTYSPVDNSGGGRTSSPSTGSSSPGRIFNPGSTRQSAPASSSPRTSSPSSESSSGTSGGRSTGGRGRN